MTENCFFCIPQLLYSLRVIMGSRAAGGGGGGWGQVRERIGADFFGGPRDGQAACRAGRGGG